MKVGFNHLEAKDFSSIHTNVKQTLYFSFITTKSTPVARISLMFHPKQDLICSRDINLQTYLALHQSSKQQSRLFLS